MPIKNLGEKGAWAYPGTVHFLNYPHIISETGKDTNVNFVRTFIGSIGTKAC